MLSGNVESTHSCVGPPDMCRAQLLLHRVGGASAIHMWDSLEARLQSHRVVLRRSAVVVRPLIEALREIDFSSPLSLPNLNPAEPSFLEIEGPVAKLLAADFASDELITTRVDSDRRGKLSSATDLTRFYALVEAVQPWK